MKLLGVYVTKKELDIYFVWQPIETYDKLKKKPKYAVFYVQEKIVVDRPYAGLSALISTDRRFGSRIVTHWIQLPNDPVEKDQ